MTSIQKMTEEWVDGIFKEFEDFKPSELTQVRARGYFAGWSDRDILEFANKLKNNNDKFPLKE